ncbi:MAG TPA: hypothetical protein DIT01_03355, partial [Lentisphaeria bacterium]|nr:hypothetical protein [Lentisphaeria bacterium]
MRQLIMLGVVVLLSGTTASANQLAAAEETLVLRYAFDEGKGDVVKDKSGKGNDGQIHGARFVKLGDGYALEFDGADDYVSCPITPSLDMKDVITVEVWVRPADYAENETVIVAEWPVFGLCQGGGTGGGIWYAPKGHGTASSPPNGLTPNQWHHVVGTYDNGKMNLFMDGELVDTTMSKTNTLWPRKEIKELWIGRISEEDSHFFKGKIGAVRIYHRALSPFEVGKRHDATRDL